MGHDSKHLSIGWFTFAWSITWGIAFAVMGLLAWLAHWGVPMVELLASVYPGFGPTLVGTIIGAVWGLIDGAIMGFLIAFFYNKGIAHCDKHCALPNQPK